MKEKIKSLLKKKKRETDFQKSNFIHIVIIAAASCLIYAVSAGVRANYGIMMNGISENSGISYSSVSFVIAIAQLVYGITQPLFGVLSMKKSPLFVLNTGAILMVSGLAGIPLCRSMYSLLLFLGVLVAAGTGALSFGVIMGAATPMLDPKAAAAVSGIVTAGSGVGSTILAPLLQKIIAGRGLQTAMSVLCVPIICMIPLSIGIFYNGNRNREVNEKEDGDSLKKMFLDALHNKSYIFLMIGFFTCGFHMAIIETHLFSQFTSNGLTEEIAASIFSVYGIAVITGSVTSGILDSKFPMKYVLGTIYALRVGIVILLLVLPKTAFFMYGVAILLGLTAASTVPPTSGLVGKLFGTEKMAALFGVVFFSHQVGSFFSSWFGGICVQMTGGYTAIWMASISLSAIAAVASFSVKEPRE